ncbi:MAG: DUF4172 domain-containing protein [Betaproteobacteria bacterium]
MIGGDYTCIWQASDWPSWRYDLAALAQSLADVSRAQGLLVGRLADVGMALRDQASLSAQIQRERKAYYDILERTQKQSMDVTEGLAWFLATLDRAVDQAQHTLDAVLVRTRFWQRWAAPGSAPLNERQVKLIIRLLDGFQGKLTSSKWAAIAKCPPDTALRDITDLLARDVLRKSDAGGRSTNYELDDSPR